MLQLLENMLLVLLPMNVFAAGECVSRREFDCSVVGDTGSLAVVLMICWCCEGEFGASTAGKLDTCAAADECVCCW